MRHISILFTVSLTACTLVGGAPAKLGAPGPVSGSEPAPAPGVGSKYTAATEVPRNLKSPQHSLEIMQEGLEKLEKKLESGTLNNPEDIHSLRISWLTYFGAMERGGEPRCEACKRNPEYARMKAATADINNRFAALEKAVAKCTYGYRMSNGDLLPMTLDWSEEEWKDIVEKAMPPAYMQKERCWTDDKAGKAGKPNGWAY